MKHRISVAYTLKKRLAALLFLLLAILVGPTTETHAAAFRPIITNFTPAQYGLRAGLQNWDCSQGPDGTMYFANNRGLLAFDGYTWQQTELPGSTLVRSVKVIGERIYVGGYEEFGYFVPDEYGILQYTSLVPLLKGQRIDHEEPWNIVEHNGDVYFQTFASILVYTPKKAGEKIDKADGARHRTALRPENDVVRLVRFAKGQPLYLHQVGDKLWVQLIDGGYGRFAGKNFVPVIMREQMGNDNVVAAMPRGQNDMLLATERHGLFLRHADGTITHFDTQIDNALTSQTVNRVVMLANETVVIGTILGGVYAINHEGRLLWQFNMPDGLVNNSVLRVTADATGNVWACLDGGIAVIHSGLPLTFFKPAPWEQPIGMVYGMLLHAGQLLMATNQGFYTYPLDQSGSAATLVAGTQGQNWHVTRYGSQVFVGGNSAPCEWVGGVLRPIAGTEAASTSMLRCTLHAEDVLLETSYATLRIYHQDAGRRWQLRNVVEGLISPLRHCVVDNRGQIWAANMNKGVFRLRLTPDLRSIESQHYYETLDSTLQPSICYAMKFLGHVVLSDSRRLYRYNDIDDRIEPYDALNNVLPSAKDIHSIVECRQGAWVTGKSGYSLVAGRGDSLVLLRHLPVEMLGLIGNEAFATAYIDGQRAYFNMADGIVCYDQHYDSLLTKAQKDSSNIAQHLHLLEAHYLTSGGQLERISLDLLTAGKAKIDNNLSLLLSYPDFDHSGLTFSLTLDGYSHRTLRQASPQFDLKNLSYGGHRLHIEATAPDGRVLDAVDLRVKVGWPWFLTIWAFMGYAVLIAFGARYYSHWQTRRALALQKTAYDAEVREQHIKVLEQERVIAEQQRQILETELSSQSKELASLAMDVLSKEQVLENLRETMSEQRQKGNLSHRDMTALMQRIRETEGNLEFWNIYQKNFDLIHEHFFRNLKERYPSLTSTDLKFCALLRLNLSTKDIAKFTNISVRGVESARLRLRRKFALAPDQNLVEFLIGTK